MWVNNNRRAHRIIEDRISEGWQRQIWKENGQASFRLPCFVSYNNSAEKLCFFRYVDVTKRGRRVIGWWPSYKPKDETFKRFIDRFHENGNLCFGEKKYWAASDSGYLKVKGIFWPLPKFNAGPIPRKKSILASQPTDDTEYVYLIRMGRHKIYKIGKSNDPQSRLDSLQSANPHKLKLLHVFRADNASAAEESLHHMLHKQRMEGEWFSLSDIQKNAIMSIAKFELNKFHVKNQLLTVEELLQTA